MRGRIVVFGDWHGNEGWAKSALRGAVKSLGIDHIQAFIHVGDFGYWDYKYMGAISNFLSEFKTPLYFIDGNHEKFPNLLRDGEPQEDGTTLIAPYLYYCPRGLRLELFGHRILFLGGAGSIDRTYRTAGVDWFPEEFITDADVAKAVESDKPVDILISHDSPTVPPMLSPLSWVPQHVMADCNESQRKLKKVVDTVKPAKLIHGHYHVAYRGSYNETEVYGLDCDASTFPENRAFIEPDGSILVSKDR